ncbi:unnamed protein product [Linum tenue]|uniref:Regulatory protein RecX n=1 Tax=Linum tenue TaxID=586396 RepID=A0AAV0Q750_9ROSI|nr:unnamed protein product [Linum tenue]
MVTAVGNSALGMSLAIRFRFVSYLIPQSAVKNELGVSCQKVRCYTGGSSGPVRYIPKKKSSPKRNEEVKKNDDSKNAFDGKFEGVESNFYSDEKNRSRKQTQRRLPTAHQCKVDRSSAFMDHEPMEEHVAFGVGRQTEISGFAQDNQLVQNANKLAIGLLAKRSLTALELKKKLEAKKIPAVIVNPVVASLQQRGYVNDGLYAESFARSRWSSLSWGPMRIKQALLKKGVSEADAQKALKTVFQDTEPEFKDSRVDMSKPSLDHLFAQALKQWMRSQDAPIQTRKSRIIRWLQYRGFDWGVISHLLAKLESKKQPP